MCRPVDDGRRRAYKLTIDGMVDAEASQSQRHQFPAKGSRLITTVAFLAETPGSPSIEDQKACLGEDDYVIVAGRRSFNELAELLAHNGLALNAGDHVKIFALACIDLSTPMLIRELTKLLRAGVSVEIALPGVIIEPGASSKSQGLLEALDAHYRHAHGIKTHPINAATQGRKRLLSADQLPQIQAMLDNPGVTATDVARELGVARSTLFNYLDRHDAGRRPRKGRRLVE